MAYRGGSFARSLISAARSSSFRSSSSSSSLPRLRPPLTTPRRPSFATRRSMGEIGCTMSLLPLCSTGTRLTSHLTVDARAYCELTHGTFRRSCQDR